MVLEALGAASAVLALLETSLKSAEFCRSVRDNFLQIRQDAQGATEKNFILEDYSKDLGEVAKECRSKLKQTQAVSSRKIVKIANDCLKDADELAALLRTVRGSGASSESKSEAAKATFRAMKERKTIEKLENRLRAHQAAWDTVVIQDIRNQQDLAKVEQTAEFKAFHGHLQELIKKQTSAEESNSKQHAMTLARLEEMKLADETAHNKTLERVDQASRQIAVGSLVKSLSFDGQHARKEMLRDPWPSTCDWIFAEHEDYPENPAGLTEHVFLDWLKTDSPLYWISGKAGSGKSNLMNYMAGHECTEEQLQLWSGGDAVLILDFFFWRPGTPLQKSLPGLMRSLLYQLLESRRDLAEIVSQELEAGMSAGWTQLRLRQLFEKCITELKDTPLVFFVDGLDEFDGDSSELLDLLLLLPQCGRTKVCVSSRRENNLIPRLDALPQLWMEHVNERGIRIYIDDKLIPLGLQPSLAQWIAYRAGGVFLWAVAVTRSVSEGLHNGDDDAMIEKLIEQMPEEMNELFRHLLQRINKAYRGDKTLYFILRAKQLADQELLEDPNLAVIIAATTAEGYLPYSYYIEQCERLRRQVPARSGGLLEVAPGHESLIDHAWAVPQDDSADPQAWHSLEDIAAARRIVEADSLVKDMCHCENSRILWLHRSAYDFSMEPDFMATMGFINHPPDSEILFSYLSGYLKLLAVAPSRSCGQAIRPTSQKVHEAASYIYACRHHLSDRTDELLSRLRAIVTSIRPAALSEDTQLGYPGEPETGTHALADHQAIEDSVYLGEMQERVFWAACAEEKLYDYIRQHLFTWPESAGSSLAMSTMVESCCHNRRGGFFRAPKSTFLLEVLQRLSLTLPDVTEASSTQRYANVRIRPDWSWVPDHTRMSWRDPSSCVADGKRDQETMLNMVKAWLRFTMLLIMSSTAGEFSKGLPSIVLEIMQSFTPILNSREVFVAVEHRHRWDKTRLWLEASSDAFPQVALARWLPPVALREISEAYAQRPPRFRISCGTRIGPFAETRHVVACFEPPGSLRESNFEPSLFKPREDILLNPEPGWALSANAYVEIHFLLTDDKFRAALIDEIWAASPDTLDGWQQLYLLACVRRSKNDAKNLGLSDVEKRVLGL
ncbi:uncharacterized protein LTR77_007462 [Saxophila tyrrhenica]|uniref:Nephrocystin 3-like N-terminal domain-containing protein n=1 Tax=Saxophila tyrrhenica TaxID=1690608 RepID=A0AAV9P5H2_9PEZI|nr:hypothetical protein LTR77_007462 [Saxophila tyrrhenica]